MKPVSLRPLLAHIHHHRRPLLTVFGALMLGTAVAAFDVSTALPDATQWPVLQVVEPLKSALTASTQTASTAEFLVELELKSGK